MFQGEKLLHRTHIGMQRFTTQRQWHIEPISTLNNGCERNAHPHPLGLSKVRLQARVEFSGFSVFLPLHRLNAASSHAVTIHQKRGKFVFESRLSRSCRYQDAQAAGRTTAEASALLLPCPPPPHLSISISSPSKQNNIAQHVVSTYLYASVSVARQVTRGNEECSISCS